MQYVFIVDSYHVIATSWNGTITAFKDDRRNYIVRPAFTYPNIGEPKWHKDDVLSLAFMEPHFLATSSYDGEIVICNIHSGHLTHRISPFSEEPGEVINMKTSLDKSNFLI